MFKEIPGDLLLENMPNIIKAHADNDVSRQLLDLIRDHPDRKQILCATVDICFKRTTNYALAADIFKSHSFDNSYLLSALNKSLSAGDQDLQSAILEKTNNFDEVPEDFVDNLINTQHVEQVKAVVEKGFRFRENMSRAISRAPYTKIKEYLEIVRQNELVDLYPYWKKVNKHAIAEVSLIRAETEDRVVVLSRAFNFRAGLADMTYETYKQGKLTEWKPAGSVPFSDVNAKLIEEAKKELLGRGGNIDDAIEKNTPSAKKPVSLLSNA